MSDCDMSMICDYKRYYSQLIYFTGNQRYLTTANTIIATTKKSIKVEITLPYNIHL